MKTKSEIELFLDRNKISWEHNVQRRLCQPLKHPQNPILQREYPWEERFATLYGTILPNENGSGYRMWYMTAAKGEGASADQCLCYAESDDGLVWHKPMMDIQPYDGYKKTNILLGPTPNIHGPCVIRNFHNDNPAERYLLLYDSYSRYRPNMKEVQGFHRCVYSATSPDGIHWTPTYGRPAIPDKSDTGQGVVWNPNRQQYIAYLRGVRDLPECLTGPGIRRRHRYVRAAVSTDFLNWSDPFELLCADEGDGFPEHQFHQLSVTQHGTQFIGLLSVFHIDEYPFSRFFEAEIEEGTCDTQLIVSRDGINWEHVADRQVFLPTGDDGQWDSKWITTASQIVFNDDQMLFYYSATNSPRSQGHHVDIGVAALPRDRFQSLKPREDNEPAIIETIPLRVGQGDLRINADAQDGRILVELCDFNGIPLEGFTKDDCNPITSDALDHVVKWKGQSIFRAQTHIPIVPDIRLRFNLFNASLYAIYIPMEHE